MKQKLWLKNNIQKSGLFVCNQHLQELSLSL